jgi:NAD(P)-dependent dehydrogenase (short-subunit alcohol dehydrogenase family)
MARPSPPDLSDQVVLITGAGRGLGRSLALHLSRCGAVVGLADVDEEGCRAAADEVRDAGGVAHAFPADMSSQLLFQGVAEALAERTGRIDAVVNNAAFLRYEPIEQVTEDTVDRMIGAGFKSAVWGAQALLAHMDPEKGGAIVNMSSPVAFRGYPTTAIYTAVKGAVTAMTRTLAAELGPRKVRVNAVAPGSVPTPGGMGLNDPAVYEQRARSIPLRRIGRESDNDAAVAFLLSREAEYISGTVLNVDGGAAAAP